MATVVDCARERVWRALTEPAELIRWDERILSLERPKPGSPEHDTRWRYRLGSVPVDLVEEPLEIVTGQRLRSAKSMGAFRFEETYTLTDEGQARTHLSLRLAAASNRIPVVGGALDRFDVRRLATELVDDRLRQVQKWCENHP